MTNGSDRLRPALRAAIAGGADAALDELRRRALEGGDDLARALTEPDPPKATPAALARDAAEVELRALRQAAPELVARRSASAGCRVRAAPDPLPSPASAVAAGGVDYTIPPAAAEVLMGMALLPADIRRDLLERYAAQHGPSALLSLFAEFIGLANSVVANCAEMVDLMGLVSGVTHPHGPGVNLPTVFGALQGVRLAASVPQDQRMCGGCAFRLGTPANQSPGTTCDAGFEAENDGRFMCHERGITDDGQPTKRDAGHRAPRGRAGRASRVPQPDRVVSTPRAVHVVPEDTRQLHDLLPTCWCLPALDDGRLVWTHWHPHPGRTPWLVILGPHIVEA